MRLKSLVGPDVIVEFSGKYRFLSNFWSCFIPYEGLTYPSVENAYQAMKCADFSLREKFVTIKASEAKKFGKVVRMRDGWDMQGLRVVVMKHLLIEKFSQKELQQQLLDTGDAKLEEGNWWGDTYWGVCNGKGQNMLGALLMEVRSEIKENASHTGMGR